jgi:hypothetical protein
MAVKTAHPVAGSNADSAVDEVASELSLACRETESFLEPLSGIFGGEPQPNDELIRFGLNAYRRLGFSEASRIFLGRLWADAARAWDGQGRMAFLSLLLRDRHEVFEALDIAVELFRRVQFAADEVFPWLAEAHRRVANDMYQRGFWGCVDAFCSTSPEAAIIVCGRWLDARPLSLCLNVISHMVGWLRIAVRGHAVIPDGFLRIEDRLKAAGCPAWRALYIQSWTRGSESFSISEKEALDIRDLYVVADSEEETAWCLLLNSVVQADRAAWHWAHRELMSMAGPALGENSKHWVGVAALYGIEAAPQSDLVSADGWRDVFRALLPIASGVALWRNIHDTLASLANKDGAAMRQLVRLLPAQSARTWLQALKSKDFAWLFQILREKGIAPGVSADLCFAPGASVRQVGLLVFDECSLRELDPDVVRSATPTQMELLLLEAQRRHIGYGALARLHACLADRVDEIQANLPELFYDEVSLQCMNTYEYRVTLANARPGHEYLQAIVADVGERLAAIGKASRSPAFRMQAPGQARAQILHDRRFVREFSASVKQHSTFLNLFSSIHMLYGGMEPRIFLREGELSPPVQMHSSSSSVEVPRLDFLDPEGMALRRLAAATRVTALEAETVHEDDN